MKNYICLNGKKIYLTDEQVASLIDGNPNNGQTKLAEVPAKGTFESGKYELKDNNTR